MYNIKKMDIESIKSITYNMGVVITHLSSSDGKIK